MADRVAWTASLAQTDMQWLFGHALLYGVKPETLERLDVASFLNIPATTELKKTDFLNDADTLMFRGRMAIMILGVCLALLVFLWSRALFGTPGAILSLALFCFDPNFIAHSGLVTTDVGVTLFMFGTLFFLWRLCRHLTVLNAALFILFFALAFVTKFSAVLLLPVYWGVGLGRLLSPEPWATDSKRGLVIRRARSRLALLGALFIVACALATLSIWASYDFRYSAAANPSEAARAETDLFSKTTGKVESEAIALPPGCEPGYLPLEAVVRKTAVERRLLKQSPLGAISEQQVDRLTPTVSPDFAGHVILFASHEKLLPEAFLFGFACSRLNSLQRGSFLDGQISNVGFRSYFLWAFLYKTPLLTLLAIVAGLLLAVARKLPWHSSLAFIVVPVGVYITVSIFSHLNIGHRHLLPIYPFLFVLAGGLGREWETLARNFRLLTAVAGLVAIVISCHFVFAPPWSPARVEPHFLSYFNELAGGPRNGYKHLGDSNLDWGQELKHLKTWLAEHHVQKPIVLCYFGTADPRYYGILHYNPPGGYPFEPQQPLAEIGPGSLIAISATDRQGIYYTPGQHSHLERFLANSKPVDTVGYSIFIYQFQPEAAAPP